MGSNEEVGVKYSHFEALAVGVGAVTVLATVFLALQPQPDWTEIAAQLLLLPVLVGAVHWGRRGGLVAALGATLAYLILRMPNIVLSGLEADVLQLVLIRTVTYGFVGIVGGELCGRIKYFFAKLEDSLSIDEHSRVYNQRFVAQLLGNSLGEASRYGTVFSIALVEMAPTLTADLRPARVRSLVRAAADYIRNDVRLVDDVGRLDDGRFVLVFPHTPRDGAQIATRRVRSGVRDVLGAKDDSVAARVMGSVEDRADIQALLDAISPQPEAEPQLERRVPETA
jgi:GGDEF domain-containing protein